MDELLHEGMAAARAGQRGRARELLMRAVELDQENATAWLWLSGVVDSLDEREVCLENVLTLNPAHEAARQGLAWVREQKEIARSSSPEAMPLAPASPQMPPAERKDARKPVSPAAAVLREDFARHQPPPEPEPEPPPVPLRDEFEDEYLCPYCAAPTRPDDRECRGCGNKLWIKLRRREERSSWLWVAMTVQAAGVIWPAAVALLMLMFAAYQAGLDNFFRLVPVYLGLPGDVPPKMAAAALEWLPRLYVLPFFVFSSLSLAVLVGLYVRWKPIFYLFLVSAVLISVFAFAGIAVAPGLPREGMVRAGLACSGGGVILALLMFLLLLQIQDDFFFDEKRLLLRPDRDATNGPALLNSGQRYARRNMWALAAIHLRRAVSQIPHEYALDCHLALSMAYLNLKRYELAVSALEEARSIAPDDPRVEHLSSVLMSRRAAASSSR